MTRILTFAIMVFLLAGPMLTAQGSDAAAASPPVDSSLTTSGGSGWVVAVNLVIWTGIFVYLLSLHNKIRTLEKNS